MISKARMLLVAMFVILYVAYAVKVVHEAKRADYILPMYPAAAIIVAQLWLSLVERPREKLWNSQIRIISVGYLAGCLCMVFGLIAFMALPDAARAVVRAVGQSSEKAELLLEALVRRSHVFVLPAVPLVAVSILGVRLSRGKNLKPLLMTTLAASGFAMVLYYQMLSPKALRMSGEQKKAFCEKAAKRIGLEENLQFLNVKNSLLFYTGRNARPLSHDEALDFMREADAGYLITTEADYLALQERAGYEFPVLEENDYIIREKRKYVLLANTTAGAVP